MTVSEARQKVTETIASALAFRALGDSDALGMALSLLHHELDDLVHVARAEGEAEGRLLVEREMGTGHA